jgi:polysaccharide deacetylase family protein (PEP-CTERM system associated)
MLNILTVDVEEYFHPAEVQASGRMEAWPYLPSRVEGAVDRLLELFALHRVTATFFIVGWVAERAPAVARKIAEAGHEIGCHSYAHRLVYRMTPREFLEDTQQAVRAIEDACGIRPRLYRAPSYSVINDSMWALDILVQCGFTHDSSIFPVIHDRYGIPGFGRFAQTLETPSGPILEVPVATTVLANGAVLPVGGGGYLRLLPYRYTAAGIRRLNRDEERPACVYFHPWEIDEDQPRIAAGFLARARTYVGIRGMERKLVRLLSDFRFSTLGRVYPEGFKPATEPLRVAPTIAIARA